MIFFLLGNGQISEYSSLFRMVGVLLHIVDENFIKKILKFEEVSGMLPMR